MSVVIELVCGADQLGMLEMPAVPAVDDHIELRGVIYKVVSRHWMLTTDRIHQVSLMLVELERRQEE